MARYFVSLPPGHYRDPSFPAVEWRDTARRVEAVDAADAAGKFVESYGGTRWGLSEVAPWEGAHVFAYTAFGKVNGRARVLVALEGAAPVSPLILRIGRKWRAIVAKRQE